MKKEDMAQQKIDSKPASTAEINTSPGDNGLGTKSSTCAKAPRRVVVVDLDGTIADASRRERQFLQGTNKDWIGFFRDMENDPPIAKVLDRVKELQKRYEVVALTGRPEKYRKESARWLEKMGVRCSTLLMRRGGDSRPDYEAKAELLDELIASGCEVALALDDREPVCAAYRARGVKVVHIHSSMENQLINEAYRLMQK